MENDVLNIKIKPNKTLFIVKTSVQVMYINIW